MSKNSWIWCAVAAGTAYLLWSRRRAALSGLGAFHLTNITPEQACASWGGRFLPGTVTREPQCKRIGFPGVRRNPNIPADTLEIVPGLVVRDTSLPTPDRAGRCPRSFQAFKFPTRIACLRKCKSAPRMDEGDLSHVTTVSRNKVTGQCRYSTVSSGSDSSGSGAGAGE